MKAILLTSWQERGQNVYKDRKVNEINKQFKITNKIYAKKDIVSAENDFRDVEIIFASWGMEDYIVKEIKDN